MKKVFIILVNYNGYKYTIECLKSLEKINYKNYKIIVVDNDSTDNSLVKLNEYKNEKLVVIKSDKNLGFAGGNNIGIKYALNNGAEYILLLNNDTEVEPDFLEKMVETAESDKKIGIVGCKIKYYNNKNLLWYAGGKINWFKFNGEQFGLKEIDKGQYNIKRKISFLTGCCMLIKKEVIDKIGLLAEEYFMYFEDSDYCVKVQEAGYDIIYEPSAAIYHKVGMSTGEEASAFAIRIGTRNRKYFMKKYRYKVSTLNFFISFLFFYLTRVIFILKYIINGDKEKAKAIIKGLGENLDNKK